MLLLILQIHFLTDYNKYTEIVFPVIASITIQLFAEIYGRLEL